MKKTKSASGGRGSGKRAVKIRGPVVGCNDPAAFSAFVLWHQFPFGITHSLYVKFSEDLALTKGRRAVIEHVSARMIVKKGERVRLRMSTEVGDRPGNIDFVTEYQGTVSGSDIYIVSHSLRAYTDYSLEFCADKDSTTPTGTVLICVSGYIAAQ